MPNYEDKNNVDVKDKNNLAIVTRSLSKSYENRVAVDNIYLDVKRGRVFGFLGPNGAGKSTAIKLLTTLIEPTQGKINILGIDALENPLEVRKRIGVVFQQPSYEPTLSVEKSLEKYGMMWDVPKYTARRRAQELLESFELKEIRDVKNEELSIGQRRRVQVAREFMHDMDLLFLDEPTVGLDPSARRKLLSYIRNRVTVGLTIFFTTHILDEAEYLCDDIAIINKGKIIALDTPSELKAKYGRQKTILIRLQNSPEINKKRMDELLVGVPDYMYHDGDSITQENSKGSTASSNNDNNFGDRVVTTDFTSSSYSSVSSYSLSLPSSSPGPTISIRSSNSEAVLLKILKILSDNDIHVQDLSVTPTSLEEIFLSVVDNSNASNS